MHKNYSDNKLLEEVTNGQESALDEIHSRYSSRMFLYAFNILNNKQVCEDIVQTVFISLWANRNKLKIQNLQGYLFKAVKFQIFNHFRANKISKQDLSRLNIIDVSGDVIKKLEFEELEKKIHQHISSLPYRCQEIFKMSRFDGKSNKEIAQELGISLQGVKNQISKAIKSIKKMLKKDELIFFLIFYSR